MNLKFVIDEKYDFTTANKYHLSEAPIAYMESVYSTSMPYLEETVKMYQQSWDKISKDFSDYVEQTTGYAWFYPEYTCVLSVLFAATSNWGEAPIIMRDWRENPLSMRRITAHELILSHYFEIINHHYTEHKLSDEQVWALAETAAMALVSLPTKVKDFWPWNIKYSEETNYPQLSPILKEMKKVFLKEKDFSKYIIAGIKLIKKYPTIAP